MPLEQLANIAEVFGMIVIVVTLIFLTVQVRQNTSMLRSTATQGAIDQVSVMYGPLISDPSVTEIFIKGLDDPSTLSPVETGQFFSFWLRAFFIVQNWYFQTREGLMEEDTLNSFTLILTDLSQSPGLQHFWKLRKYAFAPEFVRYLDDDVFARSPNPEYRPLGSGRAAIPS